LHALSGTKDQTPSSIDDVSVDYNSSIANFSFSVPKFEKQSDYTELCNIILKTLA